MAEMGCPGARCAAADQLPRPVKPSCKSDARWSCWRSERPGEPDRFSARAKLLMRAARRRHSRSMERLALADTLPDLPAP